MRDSTSQRVENRMTIWLNEQADHADVPDQHRQRYIDAIRHSYAYAWQHLVVQLQEAARNTFTHWPHPTKKNNT